MWCNQHTNKEEARLSYLCQDQQVS